MARGPGMIDIYKLKEEEVGPMPGMADRYKLRARRSYPVFQYDGTYGMYGQTVEEDIAQIQRSQEEIKSKLSNVGTYVTLGLIVVGGITVLRLLTR